MRFSLDLGGGAYVIRAYSKNTVTVNDQAIRRSVVIMPERLITDWPPQRFEDLDERHFQQMAELEPEIVLLGTGDRQRFPHPRLIRSLVDQGIGVEIMSTAAACRTYNILMAEGRRVAAALLMI